MHGWWRASRRRPPGDRPWSRPAGRLARRIAVNAIAPGPFESDMLQKSLAAEIGLSSPLRRPGGLDDLAGLVQFLGSRSSAFLTGTVIPFGGGLSITR
ncbi:SDR family oxidoreductase [Streptomyces sp. NPDC059496]|uniref:SDR family oxidoreductase n=1 Tax=Streptomyces sp. NPDC059496 TaxID=3346851 RepID=UPI0036C23C53